MDSMDRRSFLRGGLAAVCVVTVGGVGLAGCASPNQKMGTLSDTFPGTSLNGALWDFYGTVSLAEGIVTLTDTAYTASYAGIKSLAPYDLTDSQLEAQLVSAGTQAASTQACLQVTDSGGTNSLTFLVTDGNLQAQQQVAGSHSTLASAAYSAASMAWVRIREAAGITYFEYSADAKTWTALWSGADPITETALNAVIQHGMRSATDQRTSSRWAMANPSAAVLLATTTGLTSLGPYNLQVNEYNSTAALDITSHGETGPRLRGARLSAERGQRRGTEHRPEPVLRQPLGHRLRRLQAASCGQRHHRRRGCDHQLVDRHQGGGRPRHLGCQL